MPSAVSVVYAQSSSSTDLIEDEVITIYYSNLERRNHGLPPLRWNRQLTESARWFAWDTIVHRSGSYCGHTDTLNRSVGGRAAEFNYPIRGLLGENAICGDATPADAVAAWMQSDGHRQNLLNANYREIGVGYYRTQGNNARGYIVQDLGQDKFYAPVIIENEMLTTTVPAVNLYIYDRTPNSHFFEGMGSATEMMIANHPSFHDAQWEPYVAEKSWTLEPGEGWRTVYVMTRDAEGRTMVAHDTIYLGTHIPLHELTLYHASSLESELPLRDLLTSVPADSTRWTSVQFSLNWMADDKNENLSLVAGQGQRIEDSEAVGGTAFQLTPGGGTSYAWLWTHDFYTDVPLVAYLRAKVSDNSSDQEVFRMVLNGGGAEHTLALTGRDFAEPNQYLEFALPFTALDNPDNEFLAIHFYRVGDVEVAIDNITFFTQSALLQPEMKFAIPGQVYRGAGLWLRFANSNDDFSSYYEMPFAALNLPAPTDGMPTASQEPEEVVVEPDEPLAEATFERSVECAVCEATSQWAITSNQPWLLGERSGPNHLLGRINITGLSPGIYEGILTITVTSGNEQETISVPVTLTIEEDPLDLPPIGFNVMLPLITRGL